MVSRWRCSPAGRCCTGQPAGQTCSVRSTPTIWCTPSTPPAHRLATELPDATEVFPTHGFGSFCSATQSDATDSTIGQEKRTNPVLTASEEIYVAELLAGLDVYPAYYAHMAPANSAGPSAPDLSMPALAQPAELRSRIEAGEWVVDLRNRTVFAAGHVPGTFNFGLDGGFATYLGWLIDWGAPVTLLGETADDVATAQRELVRIGIDRPAAAAVGGPKQWTTQPLNSFPRATFADLDHVRHHRAVVVSSTSAVPPSSRRHASKGRSTSPCTSCRNGSTRCPTPRSGSTAPAATGPPLRRRSSPQPGDGSSPSTTPSTTPNSLGCTSSPTRRPATPTARKDRHDPQATNPDRAPCDPHRHRGPTGPRRGALLLDVRERNEWQTGHAPQAMHLALGQLEEHLAELPVDRLIVAVCRSGRRSAMAADLLSRRGYRVANLTGGMTAWAAAGLPVIVDRNKPGHAT